MWMETTMKVKALDSFSASEVGMIHAGQIFDASHVSEERLKEWYKRGLINEADEEDAPADDPPAKAKVSGKKAAG